MGYSDAIWFGASQDVGVALDTNGKPNMINLAVGGPGNVREAEMTVDEAKRVRQIIDHAIKTIEDERWTTYGLATRICKFIIGAGAFFGLPWGLGLLSKAFLPGSDGHILGIMVGGGLWIIGIALALSDPREILKG